MIPEEGDPGISAGRPTGPALLCLCSSQIFRVRVCVMNVCIDLCICTSGDDETFTSSDYSVFDPAFHEDKGSNLVNDRPVVTARDLTLVDLPRDSVDPDVFETYTYTGTFFTKLVETSLLSLC